jgi:hypothetical protein
MTTDTLTPTPERQRHAGERYLAPTKTRQIDRPAGKVLSSLELMYRRDWVTPEQFQAGSQFMVYYHGATRQTGMTGSYGDQRWSGTTEGQSDTETLIRPEWRTYCHQKVKEAYLVIGNRRDLIALEVLMEDGTAEKIGWRLGSESQRSRIRHGRKHVNSALDKLAIFYGLLRPPS